MQSWKQERELGISMSHSFRAAPGLCPELVVLPWSKCPLPTLALSLGHQHQISTHNVPAVISWTLCTRELTRSTWFPCKFFKHSGCNERRNKKDSSLSFPPNYHLPLFWADLLRLKCLSHQVIPICVPEININQWPFSAHKAQHSNAGPHWCQGDSNSSFISIKSAFSCQNSNFFSK